MKTIIVPIDYSKQSCKAFVFALDLAKMLDLDLMLFYVFHQPIQVSNAFHVEETILALEQEKNKGLENWAKKVENELYQDCCLQYNSPNRSCIEKQASGNFTKSGFHVMETPPISKKEVRIKYACKFGLPAEEILKAADNYQADLILMSSRGAGPIGQALLGSTVAFVINNSTVPVLTLPLHGLVRIPQVIVFAYDLNNARETALFRMLLKIVNAFKAKLLVLHLSQDTDFPHEQKKAFRGLERLDENLPDVSYSVYFRQTEDIVSGIHDFVQQHQADLLILAPQHHSYLDLLLSHSITGKITQFGVIPFLSLPSRAQTNKEENAIEGERMYLNK